MATFAIVNPVSNDDALPVDVKMTQDTTTYPIGNARASVPMVTPRLKDGGFDGNESMFDLTVNCP
ncbi:MAG: hypothetical protein JRD89_11210 [Deltaproteobacteria bacterium]|nr:hypothetical protein [Deltaproteobacteria bacterium]